MYRYQLFYYFLSFFVRWREGKEKEDSVHEYDLHNERESIDQDDVLVVSAIMKNEEQVCDAMDKVTETESSGKSDDGSNGQLTGCENLALELEEK